MPSIVRVAYFSPTHTTKTVAEEVAGALAAPLGASVEIVDLTLPGHRPADVSCGADDVLVFGFPVYAGRVPALLRDEFAHLIGQDTPAVIVGLYGNRDFDDALLEAADLLGERGFDVVAAGAFIGEGCLHCCACVKSCPEDAKYFSSESTDAVIAMLESKCLERKEPELFW